MAEEYDIKGMKKLCFKFTEDSVKTFEGHYNGENKNGYAKFFHNNGQLKKQGNFSNDKKDGWWTEYKENGEPIHAGHYVDDKKTGYFEHCKNGIIESEGFYEKNIKKETWKYYDENCILVKILNHE